MTKFNDINQNIFGLVALIISLVALATTVLQVLQQYFSSAEGYRRCAASVMGLWSGGTHRQLRLKEFRVEVVFETPVLFLASPKNKRGPIEGREIHTVDGTSESYKATKILGLTAQKQADAQATARVHTADDEKASWVTLLSTLQLAEYNARAWDIERKNATPNSSRVPTPEYGLVVQLQGKTRSWDFIPSSITKPYATTAICHLVEMMAMLGMYWKVFDQILWNLRAEGNGFILTSTTVHGLGVMVVFAVSGSSSFKENRVIPSMDVKELAFGSVPHIYDDEKYLSHDKDAQSLDLLFGTPDEVHTTLESLGCSSETVMRYKKDHKHIFSVSFEIIGMLAKVIRIRGSSFRMIPNPTTDPWLKKIGSKASWRIVRLMEVFQDKLKELIDAEDFEPTHTIHAIRNRWLKFSPLGCVDEAKLGIEVREEIHDAIEERTTYLHSQKQLDVLSVLVAHITKVMEFLDDPNSPLNTIVLANKEEALLSHYFHYIRPAVIGNLDAKQKPLSKTQKDQRNTIWLSLVFRMLCWLLIHDFDKADVMRVPSELKGSRMPVYIG